MFVSVESEKIFLPSIENIKSAAARLKGISVPTPLMSNLHLSDRYSANIYLKREDLQVVRSYKIRGAFNKISSLSEEQKQRGVICASAGNHAQGVAYSCKELKIKGTIYMPTPTPKQKLDRVRMFGEGFVNIVLEGDTFDDSHLCAIKFAEENGSVFVHPFDDPKVIEGQATVGTEILDECDFDIDYLFLPVGGGGLAAGVSTVFKKFSPHTNAINRKSRKSN